MLLQSSKACGTFATALAVLACTGGASADDVREYAAVSDVATSSGSATIRETLSLHTGAGTSFVSLTNDVTGALMSLPATFARNGVITADTGDPSVTCYNMAMNLLAAAGRAPSEPLAIYFALGGNPVAVPVTLHAAVSGGVTTLDANGGTRGFVGDESGGQPMALAVSARIEATSGVLNAASFTETTLLGDPQRAVSRTSCRLSNAKAAPKYPVVPVS